MSKSVLSVIIDNCNGAVENFKITNYRSGYIAMAVIMICFAPITVLLNTVTIYVFWREKRMKTVADMLLCFLTITDIVDGFLAMPFFAAESILHAVSIRTSCSIFLARKLTVISSLQITLVTSILLVFDRYCSIFHPYRYNVRRNQTGSLTVVVIFLWFVCITTCLLSIITSNYSAASALIRGSGALFVFFSVWVHLKIYVRVRQIHKQIAHAKSHLERKESQHECWYRIKGARVTAIMFCGIFLCYVPQIIVGNLARSLNHSRSSKIAMHWTIALLLFNSILNPMVYIWQLKWFRNALWKITSKGNMPAHDNTNESK